MITSSSSVSNNFEALMTDKKESKVIIKNENNQDRKIVTSWNFGKVESDVMFVMSHEIFWRKSSETAKVVETSQTRSITPSFIKMRLIPSSLSPAILLMLLKD